MLTRFSLVLAVCAVLGAAPRTNPLIDAVRHGDKQAVAGFLKDKTVDVNAAAPDGTTALHWAIDRDDAEAVALLIKAGA